MFAASVARMPQMNRSMRRHLIAEIARSVRDYYLFSPAS